MNSYSLDHYMEAKERGDVDAMLACIEGEKIIIGRVVDDIINVGGDKLTNKHIEALCKSVGSSNSIVFIAPQLVEKLGDKLDHNSVQELFDKVYVQAYPGSIEAFVKACPTIEPSMLARAKVAVTEKVDSIINGMKEVFGFSHGMTDKEKRMAGVEDGYRERLIEVGRQEAESKQDRVSHLDTMSDDEFAKYKSSIKDAQRAIIDAEQRRQAKTQSN